MKEIAPRDVCSLTDNLLFDQKCYDSELGRLTKEFLANIIEEDMKKKAMQDKRKFETPLPYPYEDALRNETFLEEARSKAKDILETERKTLVTEKEDHLRAKLQSIYDYLQHLLVSFQDGKVRVMSVVELGQNPRKHPGLRHHSALDEWSHIEITWHSLQPFIPYASESIKELNEKIVSLREGKLPIQPEGKVNADARAETDNRDS